MEPDTTDQPESAVSQTFTNPETTWASTSHRAGSSSLSGPTRKSSLGSSVACSDVYQHSFAARPKRDGPPGLVSHPEPQLLRLRPASLRTQDISHLLARVFRNLYSAQVFGEDVSDSLIKARGSEDARHEEFVDELQQIPGSARRLPYQHPGQTS